MSFEADQALKGELDRGERLLWSGRPRQGLRLRATDALAIPFSLMWGGFAIFWEYGVVNTPKAPGFFPLFGVPFVAIGLYMIAGRFFADSYQRGRTFYGLTDRRVIIVGGLFNREVRSLALNTLSEINLSERGDRSGTITFGRNDPGYAMWGNSWPGASRKLAPAFDLLDDARKVYELIRGAQHGAGGA